jgi:thiamine-phosphate pyrophosphorylase
MGRPLLDLSLYLVTDTILCGQFGVAATVSAAVGAGVTLVQLRDIDAADDEFVALGREVKAILRGTGVPLIVNDRAHLVAAIGADGVHVGQSDLEIAQARALVGPTAYMGLSVQTLEHVMVARGHCRGDVGLPRRRTRVGDGDQARRGGTGRN